MKNQSLTVAWMAMIALLGVTTGCVVAPREGYRDGYREGYYDHERHRYYHQREWHECIEHDEHCR